MVNANKIQALISALTNKFEEKANKITEWSTNSPSDDKYPSEALVKPELDSKQEKSAKVNSFTGTITNDNYPSALLVKNQLDLKENASNKVTAWSATLSDTNYPSEKLVKDSLDLKLESADLPTKTSDLTNDGEDGTPFLTEHQSLSSTVVSLSKQQTAETGFAATYVLSQGGTDLATKINIPKDQFVQSASLETVGSTPTDDETGAGLVSGDKYINMIINTEDNDGDGTTIFIPVNELIDVYGADNTTLTVSNGQFSIKASGVDTAQIKDSAVTTAKIDGGAITTTKIASKAVTASEIADYTITSDKIATSLSNTWLTTQQVDSEIEQYVDAITVALGGTVSGE